MKKPLKNAKSSTGVRIDSGLFKGMILRAPAGLETRPTGGRVRAAVLNMLQTELQDANILDLFAGTGALAIEAVSRGAAKAVLVESSASAIRCLNANIEEATRRLRTQGNDRSPFELLGQCVEDATAKALSRFGVFDIAWADPPWKLVHRLLPQLLLNLQTLVRKDGLFVLESDANEVELPEGAGLNPNGTDWHVEKDRVYGKTRIRCYRRV